MVRVLTNLAAGDDAALGTHGQSAHGGLTQVMWALGKRGYVDWNYTRDYAITDAGREALTAHNERIKR
jgi:hypothetical protein